jgi:spore coat-associated protein N
MTCISETAGPQMRPLIRRPKRTLGTLALGLCALGVAIGSGADFSAQTANPSNTFSAGSLSMDNSKSGAAIFQADDLKPGGTERTGVVDIKNTGSIDGVFKVTRDQLTSSDGGTPNPTPFADKVITSIVDCGKPGTAFGPYGPEPYDPTCGDADDQIVYVGTLGSQNAPIDLGTFHAGDKHRYQFGANLSPSAGDEYAGDGASARYVFDAVQTH